MTEVESSSSRRWLMRAGVAVATGLLLLGTMATQLGRAGQEAMRRSDAAFDHGDTWGSLADARDAASHYLPFAPHVERAYARMRSIAIGAEASGDQVLARRAWSSLRGAVIEVEHFRRVPEPLLLESEAQLSRLLAAAAHPEKSRRFDQAELASMLRESRPLLGKGFVVGSGFAVMALGGIGWALLLCVQRGPEDHRRTQALWLLAALMGTFVWVWASLAG